ncbi:nitrate- and nitrite sensing domain-containing protein [Streptosporangium sp. NPDC023615]|uniref:nitrate- and nitrite sensing domain-containing protein n=1 Tax=Streptosporangium sp. NPDC023615 TaxID=3154794 RepID=UPI0034131C6A
MLLLLPLLSLSALWGFALNLTIGDGISLLRANTLYQTVGVTSTDLGLQLQAERTQSSMVVSSRVITSGMGEQRARTDRSIEAFQKAAAGDEAVTPELRASLDELLRRLDGLPSIRSGVDGGQQSRLSVLSSYNQILDAVFLVYTQMTAVPDLSIFQQAAAMQGMGNAHEMIARENALVSGALVDKRMSEEERRAFGEYVTTRRFLHNRGVASLDAELSGPYRDTFRSSVFERFTELERAVAGGTGDRLPLEAAGWKASVNEVSTWLDKVNASSARTLADRAQGMATDVLIRIVIAGGVGLIAVVASIIISVRFGRRLASELAGLRSAALDLADVRLPRVVERLRRGEEVDVRAEAPPIQAGGSTEVHDVAHAFGSVQHTAVEAAVGQANLRRGVSQVFVNLARRKQSLLHRQLALLDSMQRRATDPDSLHDLFRLDHLTTRMRRHAESLIILSGAAPGRSWRRPVPVIDVLRAAIAEVEDYTRVNVLPVADVSLDGAAVADITHLVAELIENATIYSPPQTTVTVRGDVVANGFAVEVEDRGLGLSPAEYEAVNARLADPPEFDLADSDRLGLFVVGQLASRHGIQVILRGSPFGGTTAIVLLPRALLAQQDKPLTLTAQRTSYTAERVDERPEGLFEPAPREALPSAPGGGGLPRRTRGAPAVQPAAAPSLSVVTDLPARAPAPGLQERPGQDGGGETVREAPSRPASSPGDPRRPVPSPAGAALAGARAPRTPQAGQVSPETREAPSRGGGATGCPAARPSAVQPPAGPGGLPRRVRQANLAPQLRQEGEAAPAAPAPAPKAEPCEERSPDEIRAMFSAFQAGARRGREEQNDESPHHTTGDKGDK